jgi:hypothetical protein
MVVAFIASNWLDTMTPVDDSTFSVDLPIQYVGKVFGGQTIGIDRDIVTVQLLYTDLVSPASFIAKVKAAIVARASVLGHTGLTGMSVFGPTRVAIP